jgi:hypothetical protein
MLHQLIGSPQLVVRGRRIHHGLVGCWLIAIGVALILDDLPDRRVWRSDFRLIYQSAPASAAG